MRKPHPLHSNIETVVKLKEQFLQERSAFDRFSDWVTEFTGPRFFLTSNVIVVVAWMILNVERLPIVPFDTPPFHILIFIIAVFG